MENGFWNDLVFNFTVIFLKNLALLGMLMFAVIVESWSHQNGNTGQVTVF
jgi:hypothetical protein